MKFLHRLSLSILMLALLPSLEGVELSRKSGVKKVFIDAGHGGKDPGNPGTGRYSVREKDVALDVALMLGQYIEENLDDVKVIYSRQTDKFVEVRERTAMANRHKADLFISLHCDAFHNPSVHGSSTFVMGKSHSEHNMRVAKQENSVIVLEEDYEEHYEGFDPSKPETYIALSSYQYAFLDQSISFASKVQTQFRERVNRRDRGVKQAPLWVTSRCAMPAVLVEMGFLTNKQEEDFLHSDKGKSYMASAIFRAFREYKEERESIEAGLKYYSFDDELKPVGEPAIETPRNVESKSDLEEVEREPEEDNQLVFRVQIYTSAEKKEIKKENFKGIDNIDYFKENGLYKYASGRFDSYEEAREYQQLMRDKGFKGAFVIAFLGEEKIPVADALKQVQ